MRPQYRPVEPRTEIRTKDGYVAYLICKREEGEYVGYWTGREWLTKCMPAGWWGSTLPWKNPPCPNPEEAAS